MSVTDAQFLQWLKQDGVARTVLCEVGYYNDDTGAGTRYLSNLGYATEASDTPANVYYDDRITRTPDFNREIQNIFGGITRYGFGDIELDNSDGRLDSWLLDGFDGRVLKLYIGDKSWARSDFRLILDGTCADIIASGSSIITLRARDKQALLNVDIQNDTLSVSNSNNGKPVPICYGQCFNVPAVLVDHTTHEYQVHDGTIEDITDVRANGVSVAYTKYLSTGKFRLSANPFSQVITCDVKGAKPTTYLTTVADIVREIATARGGFSGSEIDDDAFDQLNVDAPYTVGTFVSSPRKILDVIGELAESVGAYVGVSRGGLLTIAQLKDHDAQDSVLSIGPDQIKQFGVDIEKKELPYQSIEVGYQKAFFVQKSGLAGSVTEENATIYGNDYRSFVATDVAVLTKNLLADQAGMQETLIYTAADAEDEANRRMALYSNTRIVYNVSCYATPFLLDIGDVVDITYSRFGLSAQKGVIVGISDSPITGAAILKVWV